MSLTSLELRDQRSILWGHGIFSGMQPTHANNVITISFGLAVSKICFLIPHMLLYSFFWHLEKSSFSRQPKEAAAKPPSWCLGPAALSLKAGSSPRWHGSCFGKWRKYQGMWSFHPQTWIKWMVMNGFFVGVVVYFLIFILKPIGLPPDVIGPSPGVALVCVERIAVRLSSSSSQSCGTAVAVIF